MIQGAHSWARTLQHAMDYRYIYIVSELLLGSKCLSSIPGPDIYRLVQACLMLFFPHC